MWREWLRWFGSWALYLLWWAGYWVALFILFLVVCSSHLPKGISSEWKVGIALAGSSFVTAWNLRRALHEDERPRRRGKREEWNSSAFVGMFCGPVVAGLLASGIDFLLRRIGQPIGEANEVGYNLILGAWLGAFTWEALGGGHTLREKRQLLLAGGIGGVIGAIGLAVWFARIPESGFSWKEFGFLAYVFSPSLLWSLALIAAAGIVRANQAPWHKGSLEPLAPLINADSVSFTARMSVAFPGGDSIPSGLLKGNKLKVHARRPGCLRVEAVDNRDEMAGERAFSVIPCNLFVTDGIRQCEVQDVMGHFVEDESAGRLDELESRYGMTDAVGAEVLFADDPLYGFSFTDVETHEEEPAWVFERDYDEGVYRQRITISRRTGLPIRIELFTDSESSPREVTRTEFSEWELNLELPDSLFDPTPPKGMRPEPPEPDWYDSSIVPGMEPALFEAEDIQGTTIRLEDYRGRVVLLDFWAVWCGPCAEMIPEIQSLYERYHSDGLEVIGISFDTEEQRERMDRFIAERRVPWPIICDGEGFRTALARPYGINAIPFVLLIGRDGKIAAVNPHGRELDLAIRTELAKPSS